MWNRFLWNHQPWYYRALFLCFTVHAMLLHTIQFPSVCFQKKFYYGLLRCFMSCIANWRWKRCEKFKIIEIKWRIKEKLKESVGLTFTLNQTMGRNENNHKKWEITNSTHYSKSYFSWYFQSSVYFRWLLFLFYVIIWWLWKCQVSERMERCGLWNHTFHCVCSFEQQPACSFITYTNANANAKHNASSVERE